MKKALQIGLLYLLIHSIYAYIVHVDLQDGSGLLQWTTIIVDPIATLGAIEYDLDGNQYFRALVFVGGLQWFIIGVLIAKWRQRSRNAK